MAGKKKAQPASGSGSRVPLVIGALVLVAVAALGYNVVTARAGGAALQPVDLSSITDPREVLELADGITLGPDDAPLKMVTFIDFQCPGCRHFGTQVEPLVRQHYVEPGHLQIIFYDWPIVSGHPHAFVAARAARCANEQGRFWEYHDVLLARQTLWSPERTVVNTFVEYAAELGLNRSAFDRCLKSDRYAETVTAGIRLGYELGVNGTPTIIVNNRPLRNWQNFEDVRRFLDEELGA